MFKQTAIISLMLSSLAGVAETTRVATRETRNVMPSRAAVVPIRAPLTAQVLKPQLGSLPPVQLGILANKPIIYNPPSVSGDQVLSPFEPGHFVVDDPDQIAWRILTNRNESYFKSKVVQYKRDGYILNDLEIYTVDGQRKYAGIFYRNEKNRDSAALANLSQLQFDQQNAAYEQVGFRLVDQEVHIEGNTRYHTAIFNKNVRDVGWRYHSDRNEAQFKQDFDSLKNEYRIVSHETYLQADKQLFTTVWVKNSNNRNWKIRRGLSRKGYSDYQIRSRDEGYRPQNFLPNMSAEGLGYSTVWRQNTDRPQWTLKTEIDDIVDNFYTDNLLPGLTVGIAKDGKFQYLRGIGKADLANDVIAQSRTVYRIASVSKAIAGVLTAKLVESNPNLSYDDTANSWLPALPTGHDYTIGNLVNNRAGFGAYAEYSGTPTTTAFSNAWAGSQFFMTGDFATLPFPIGSSKYSTHGYSVLGAAESKGIFQIINDELTAPHNLPSIVNSLRHTKPLKIVLQCA